jgi:hypothetical protein
MKNTLERWNKSFGNIKNSKNKEGNKGLAFIGGHC